MSRRTRKATGGSREALRGRGGPKARDHRREGAGGPSRGPGDGCPCVTCQWATDCGDDFYCPEFEGWFASRPSSGLDAPPADRA